MWFLAISIRMKILQLLITDHHGNTDSSSWFLIFCSLREAARGYSTVTRGSSKSITENRDLKAKGSGAPGNSRENYFASFHKFDQVY